MAKLASRYRSIHVSMYFDRKFQALSRPQPNGQSLWTYLLTGPHTGIIPGLSRASEVSLADDLRWPLEGFRKAFAELSEKDMVKVDRDAHVLWIPNALKFNPPGNPNVAKSWGKGAIEIPECDLKDQAIQAVKDFLKAFGEGFLKGFQEGLGKAYGEGFAESESESESESGGERRSPRRAIKSHPGAEDVLSHFADAWAQKYAAKYPIDEAHAPTDVEKLLRWCDGDVAILRPGQRGEIRATGWRRARTTARSCGRSPTAKPSPKPETKRVRRCHWRRSAR